MTKLSEPSQPAGILIVDKPKGISSFKIVSRLRKRLGVKKIGHAGTLDPIASGVMVMLIGREYTRLSDTFLWHDKAYQATLTLGVETSTYDTEGKVMGRSDLRPTLSEVVEAVTRFQGEIEQVPPMYSAKKVNGQKLYDLARKGITIERKPVKVRLSIELIEYHYPKLQLKVDCSKGTYIRSLAFDLGKALGCGAHLEELVRIKSGPFTIESAVPLEMIEQPTFSIQDAMRKSEDL